MRVQMRHNLLSASGRATVAITVHFLLQTGQQCIYKKGKLPVKRALHVIVTGGISLKQIH